MRRIDKDVAKLTEKPLGNPCSMNDPGPSTWFSISIWAAVLDGIYRNLGYKVEPYDRGLFKAQYGAAFIGLTETIEESERYIELHKTLMAKYGKSRTVKAVNMVRQMKEPVTQGIRNVLTKFMVDKHIPGKCNYEFCR